MTGLFCSSKANNNDEYRKVIKSRMLIWLFIFIIGGVTLAVALLAMNVWSVEVNEHMLGVYAGAGTGLMASAVFLWIANFLLLKNEEKLKESRLKDNDERLQEIRNKAIQVASICLVMVLYVVGLIGGLYYPILVKVLLLTVGVFLLVYAIAYKIYERIM